MQRRLTLLYSNRSQCLREHSYLIKAIRITVGEQSSDPPSLLLRPHPTFTSLIRAFLVFSPAGAGLLPFRRFPEAAAASLSALFLLARQSWPRRGTVNASTMTADMAWIIMAIAEHGNYGHGDGYTIGTAVMARHNDDRDNDDGDNDGRHGDGGNDHRKA